MSKISYNNNNRESIGQLPGILISKGKRDIEHLSKNMFSKNLEHKIIGKDSPGPGCYNDQVDSVWNNLYYLN